MAKLLVTGGLGVVGAHLCTILRQKGHQVWLVDRFHHHDPQYIRCDIGQMQQLERVFRQHKFDYVYNLAAEFGRWNGEDFYENLWQTNVVGTKHLIRLQERLGFRLIHASSSEVYGDFPGTMHEDVMEKHEIRQANDYAITKWVNELQIMNSALETGAASVRFRIFNTYGPGEHYSTYRSVVCRFVYSALAGLPYTVYTGHTRTHTYIADAAEWISRICDNFRSGEVYNIAGSERTDIKTISDEILAVVGRDDRIVTYKELEPMTTKDKAVDSSKMRAHLGDLNETSLKEGIRHTIAWMKDIYRADLR